jgi:hypothetical protein
MWNVRDKGKNALVGQANRVYVDDLRFRQKASAFQQVGACTVKIGCDYQNQIYPRRLICRLRNVASGVVLDRLTRSIENCDDRTFGAMTSGALKGRTEVFYDVL